MNVLLNSISQGIKQKLYCAIVQFDTEMVHLWQNNCLIVALLKKWKCYVFGCHNMYVQMCSALRRFIGFTSTKTIVLSLLLSLWNSRSAYKFSLFKTAFLTLALLEPQKRHHTPAENMEGNFLSAPYYSLFVCHKIKISWKAAYLCPGRKTFCPTLASC